MCFMKHSQRSITLFKILNKKKVRKILSDSKEDKRKIDW